MSGTQNLLIATMNGYKWIFPSSTNTFHGIFWGKHIHSWLDNAGLQMFSSFYCLTMWQYKSHFCQYLQSPFRCDSDIGLILTASNIFPAQSEPLTTPRFIALRSTSSRARDPLCLSWRWRQFFWPFLCGRSACSSQSSSSVVLCRASQSNACASLFQ